MDEHSILYMEKRRTVHTETLVIVFQSEILKKY